MCSLIHNPCRVPASSPPPRSDWQPPDGNESEEDIIIPRGGTQVSLKCPCTAATLEDPVKSKVCLHVVALLAAQKYVALHWLYEDHVP